MSSIFRKRGPFLTKCSRKFEKGVILRAPVFIFGQWVDTHCQSAMQCTSGESKRCRGKKGVVNFQNRNLIGVVTCNKDVFVCTLYHCKIHYIHYRIAVYDFALIKYEFRGRWSVQSQKTGVVQRKLRVGQP